MMKVIGTTLVASMMFVGIAAAETVGSDAEQVTDDAELQSIFEGRTAKGEALIEGRMREFQEFFNENGSTTGWYRKQGRKTIDGEWWIENGQACFRYSEDNYCRDIYRRGDTIMSVLEDEIRAEYTMQ